MWRPRAVGGISAAEAKPVSKIVVKRELELLAGLH